MGFNVYNYILVYYFNINITKMFRYFGRKRLQNKDEKYVGESEVLVHAGYSYWTLGYVITYEGAKKLLGKLCL